MEDKTIAIGTLLAVIPLALVIIGSIGYDNKICQVLFKLGAIWEIAYVLILLAALFVWSIAVLCQ